MLSAPDKIQPLTTLRFFAAAVVVLGHSSGNFLFGDLFFSRVPAYQGVTMFFVLSGFILTYAYPTLPKRSDVERFLVARIARVWPLHVATFVIAVVLLADARATLFSPTGPLFAALNVSMMHALVPTLSSQFSYNAVSWSISTEIIFYVCFVGLIARREDPLWRLLALGALGPLLMVGLSLLLNLPLYDPAPHAVSGATMYYIHPIGRMMDFVVGIGASLLFSRFKQPLRPWFARYATAAEVSVMLLCLGSMVLTYAVWARMFPFLPSHSLLWLERSGATPIYALTIFVFAFSSGALSRKLSQPVMVMLGEISFALYLSHQILMRWVVANRQLFEGIPAPLVYAAYILVTLAVSWVLWRIIELPARSAINSSWRRLPT